MRRGSLAFVSMAGARDAWEAACVRAAEAVRIRSSTQAGGADAPPERDARASYAGCDLPDGLDSLLCVLASSPAS